MQSILSFPERGPWGKASYPGNCSGYVVKELIQYFRPKSVADPCEGSGTTKDVCATLRVPYWGADLREGFDLTSTPVFQVCPFAPDLVILHPPYFRIVRYSGKVWGTAPNPRDLSQVNEWEEYLSGLFKMVGNCVGSVAPGGRVALIIGDVRQRGSYYSAAAEVIHAYQPDHVEAVLIKEEHHVRSDKTTYTGNFIRIMHEYVIVLRGRPLTDDERHEAGDGR